MRSFHDVVRQMLELFNDLDTKHATVSLPFYYVVVNRFSLAVT